MNDYGLCTEECDADQCANPLVAMLSCPVFSDCIDKCDGFECECYDGYQMINGECRRVCDEDQCSTDPCPSNSQCVDLCDQYRCDCDSGYSENELDECCEDLNQCVLGIPDLGVSPEDVCAPNFFCINSCVGFQCVCGDGFEEQNGNCMPETETTVVDTTTSTPSTTKESSSTPTSDPSSVYEDPHFHVRGLSREQPDLCFDYDGIPGHDMTIISDSDGTKVIGALYKPHANISQIYFESIEIRTPERVGITVRASGWQVHRVFNPRHLVEPKMEGNSVFYDDLEVKNLKRVKNGFQITGKISSGISFMVQSNEKHGNVNFRLLDQTSLSRSASGVLGQFMIPGCYEVVSDNDSHDGFLNYHSQTVKVRFQGHAWNKNCWFIQKKDAKSLIEK